MKVLGSRFEKVLAAARRLLLALAWLLLATVIALGAAGLIASMNHLPGSATRPELTWVGDQAARPALDAATAELSTLSDRVDALAGTARQSLTDVVGGDVNALSDTIDTGTLQVDAVRTQTTRLVASLGAVPGMGEGAELRVSAGVIARYQALLSTQNLTSGLANDWLAFTSRAVDAARLTGLLTRHDKETAAAAKEGAAGHYRRALKLLDVPDATLAEATRLRDDLASTTDVSTLSAWLDRNATYDAALRDLYQSLANSKGRVTKAVRRAFAEEAAARSQLPADTRGLVVIMSDIARGGLNQAVIAIERARGSLATALELQQQIQQGGSPDAAAAGDQPGT